MKNGRRRRGDFGQQTFIALGGVHTGPNLDRLIFFPRGGGGDFAGFADGVDGRPPVLFGGKQLQIDDRWPQRIALRGTDGCRGWSGAGRKRKWSRREKDEAANRKSQA